MNGLLNQRFTVYRRTNMLLDPVTLSASDAADRTPSEPYVVEVEVSGGSVAGSVTVAGTSGGAPASQTLAFSAAGRKTTTRAFDKNTAVTFTTTGWTGSWTIGARALKQDGSPLRVFTTLQTAWPGRVDRRRGTWGTPKDGSVQAETPYAFIAFTTSWTPREGDELVNNTTGERWRVESVPPYDNATATHHWEVGLARAEI